MEQGGEGGEVSIHVLTAAGIKSVVTLEGLLSYQGPLFAFYTKLRLLLLY